MDNETKDIPSRGFAKLASGIVDSTIWMKPHDALRVWIALLAKSDSYGIVRIASPALAHQCFVTPERLDAIMHDFCSPDPDSRSPDHDGCRLQRIEGGWLIVNYLKYRDMMQRKAASHAERQAKYREKIKARDARVTRRVTGDTEADSRGREQSSRGKDTTLPEAAASGEREFDSLWSVCAKKVGKARARKAYLRLRKAGTMPEASTVTAALVRLQQTEQWTKRGRQYQPHLEAWLNRGGWDDEIPKTNGGGECSATSGAPSSYGISDETRARLEARQRKSIEESRRELEQPDPPVSH